MKIKGAMVFGGVPSNQEEDQKEALEPSPMVTRVAALKRSLSVASLGVSDPTHGFSGAFHSSHNHRSLSARENFSMSRTPRPPRSLGRQTFCQLTLHFPPLTTSLQAQSIPRLILAKAFRMLLSTFKADNRKMGSEERTDFTRAVQPALFRNLPFQGFKRATALSMKGWRSARLSLPSDRGRPRYLSLYLCSPLAYISKQKLQHTLVAIFGADFPNGDVLQLSQISAMLLAFFLEHLL